MNRLIIGVLIAGLSACDSRPAPDDAAAAQPVTKGAATVPSEPSSGSAERTAIKPIVALTPSDAAVSVQALAPASEQDAASVVRVDPLLNQGDVATIKLYGAGGGDPAMNGLYSYLAFFEGVDAGWTVFRIGDFLDYRVLDDRPGRVDLEVTESVVRDEGGDIGSRKRRLIVAWPVSGSDGAPGTITVTPAQ